MSGDGMVGQRTASIRSGQGLYLKWTGPQRYRAEDAPRIDMVAFNQGEQEVAADLVVIGAGLNVNQSVALKRGANYVRLPVSQSVLQSGVVNAEIKVQGKTVDRLQTTLTVEPTGWLSQRELARCRWPGPTPRSSCRRMRRMCACASWMAPPASSPAWPTICWPIPTAAPSRRPAG
ncbi:hypothetical protein ACU4GD_00750 [Cupriavidus basilensis]